MTVRTFLPTITALGLVAGCISTQGRLTRTSIHPSSDPDRAAYVAQLEARAHKLDLGSATQWRRLGHWQRTRIGILESQADGDNFFLSPDGKRDPDRELDATLEAFFSDLAVYDHALPENKNIQHPICQFPARFAWLSEQLAIDPARLPAHDCARYQEFRDSLQAESATLVFSSYYLNNPASAFGHTFLRINKKNAAVAEDKRQLLDYGIEFSADPDTDFAPLYAIKGMVGAFPGTFRKLPYYLKVREYNDFESRDLWEYKLNLTPAELDRLVAHVWELGSTFFDYFYLTENCSYHILGALEAAVPTIELTEHLHWPVIPSDAIKALYATPGLVDHVEFRPSMRTRFRSQLHGLTDAQVDILQRLPDDPKAPLPPMDDKQKIAVLDAAQDLVDMRFTKDLAFDKPDTPGAKVKQELLERRAEIQMPSVEQTLVVPWQRMPQDGHDSRRFAMGLGADSDSGRYLALGARLALHDLADPTEGYPELSQLEFLPTRARYDYRTDKFQLDQLDLVHVVSLTAQNPFDRHVSWEFRLGSERLQDEGCHCYAAHAQFGGGVAFSSEGERFTLFALAETHVWSGPGLDGILGAPIRVGIGPGGGLRIRLTPRLVSLFLAEWDWLPGQTGFASWYVNGTLRWEVVRALAIDLNGYRQDGITAGVASTMLYF